MGRRTQPSRGNGYLYELYYERQDFLANTEDTGDGSVDCAQCQERFYPVNEGDDICEECKDVPDILG